jgi:REP element-mobilizing transposase RayT
MLNPLNLGNFKSRETAKQNRCYPRVAVSQRVCPEQGIYIKINYTNADHVHPIVDLPTALSIEKLIQLLKESSSHWINSNNLSTGKFAWGRGLPRTSRDKKNIIVRVHSPMNLGSSSNRHGLHWKDEKSR